VRDAVPRSMKLQQPVGRPFIAYHAQEVNRGTSSIRKCQPPRSILRSNLPPRFVKSSPALPPSPESFTASLIPASSPALSPASCLVAQPRLSLHSTAQAAGLPPSPFNNKIPGVMHGAPLPPPPPWLPLPAFTAAPFNCVHRTQRSFRSLRLFKLPP
jgi:hypothetical protein